MEGGVSLRKGFANQCKVLADVSQGVRDVQITRIVRRCGEVPFVHPLTCLFALPRF